MSRRTAAGIDVGGTHAKVVLVREDGTLLAEGRVDTGRAVAPESLVPALLATLDELAAGAGMARHAVTAAGVVVPGFVDDERSASLFSPNTPGLVGAEVPRRLGEALGFPVSFDSDVNAAALGEAVWGAGRDVRRFLAITLGTGVGAGFTVDGELARFAGGTIGDVGHIILDPSGPSCTAGCHGCAEALVGAAGVVRAGRAAAESLVASSPGRPASAEQPADVISAARAGEAWAVNAAAALGTSLGLLVASLAAVFLPERIALVGGTATMGRPLLDAAREAAAAVGGYVRGVPLVIGAFPSNAGALGAAALALRETKGGAD